MNNKLFNVFLFTVGAVIGSAVTWKFVKTKYEKIADEEIESVKEVYSRRYELKEKDEVKQATEEVKKEKQNLSEYADKLNKLGYNPYTNEIKADSCDEDTPYVIPPDEFGDDPEYETASLKYFSDGVLVDENNNPIEDVDYIVGEESLNHFGEYEDDSVYVRNDYLEVYYEILLDQRRYSDVKDIPPHKVE